MKQVMQIRDVKIIATLLVILSLSSLFRKEEPKILGDAGATKRKVLFIGWPNCAE
jgi:hypothetical protein